MKELGSAKFNTLIKPTWCPGCGNYGIWTALKNALFELELEPHQVLISYDIGCFSNGTNFTNTYALHSLHGRAIPPAEGAKMANKDLVVLALAGDGGAYGEGVQHFLHAARYNIDITYIVANNQRFSLTTGQSSPTTEKGDKTKTAPWGEIKKPLNPLALSLEAGASLVGRGFAGDIPHLTGLIKAAIEHKGFSHVDILQPCVTFNKLNTYEWFRERVYKLDEHKYKADDRMRAWEKVNEYERGGKLPIGILWEEERETYIEGIPQVGESDEPLYKRELGTLDVLGMMTG